MKISSFPSNLPPEEILAQHYSSLSLKFKWATRIAIAVLVLFIFLMIGFFGDKITYSNLRAFIGAIDTDYYFSEDGHLKIERELSPGERIYAYEDGILILGNGSLKYLKYNGRMLINDNISDFKDPQITLGEEFFVLYDRGGNKYFKYSVSGVDKKMTSSNSIYGVSISPSGLFTVLSNSDTGNSLVSVYNKRETLICEYKSDRFCLSALVSENGHDLFVVGLSDDMTEPSHQVTLYSIKNKKTIYSFSYDSESFIDASLFNDSRAAVLFRERLMVIDRNGKVEDERIITEKINAYNFCHGVATVIVGENKINIMAVDSENDKIYNINMPLSNNIRGVSSTEKSVYICTSNEVFSFDRDSLAYNRITFEQSVLYIAASDHGCSVITPGFVELLLAE